MALIVSPRPSSLLRSRAAPGRDGPDVPVLAVEQAPDLGALRGRDHLDASDATVAGPTATDLLLDLNGQETARALERRLRHFTRRVVWALACRVATSRFSRCAGSSTVSPVSCCHSGDSARRRPPGFRAGSGNGGGPLITGAGRRRSVAPGKIPASGKGATAAVPRTSGAPVRPAVAGDVCVPAERRRAPPCAPRPRRASASAFRGSRTSPGHGRAPSAATFHAVFSPVGHEGSP